MQSTSRVAYSRGRKLRIGYISSDFHDHPVGNNLMPLLTHTIEMPGNYPLRECGSTGSETPFSRIKQTIGETRPRGAMRNCPSNIGGWY